MADATLNDVVHTLGTVVETLGTVVGELRQTNQRLDQTNQRLDQTNQRLEALTTFTAKGFLETNTRLADLTGEVHDLKGKMHRFGERFEVFLTNAGGDMRLVLQRLDRIERHVGLAGG